MAWYFLAALLWVAASVIASFAPRKSDVARPLDSNPNHLRLGLACIALVALMVCVMALNANEAKRYFYQRPIDTVPLGVLTDDGEGSTVTTDATVALSIAETLCLWGVYRTLRGKRRTREAVAIVATTAAAMTAIALTSHVATSSDVYGYIGFGLRPTTAYNPELVRFTGDHAAINQIFGYPLRIAPYGPLWLATAHAIVAPFGSLAAQIVAMRCFELLMLAICVVALARMRVDFATIALLAVSPNVYVLWIADAHNDLYCAVLILLAALCRAGPAATIARVVLVAAAGLVKMPLVIIGLVVFSDESTRLRKVLLPAASLATCAALSYAFGGAPYFSHLAAMNGPATLGIKTVLRDIDLLLIIVALAAAIFANRFTAGATWLWPAITAAPTAWYGMWCLPYAVRSGAAPLFFIVGPMLARLYAWNYRQTPIAYLFCVALTVVPLAYVTLRVRRERRARTIMTPART
jgi:hypothetical protein